MKYRLNATRGPSEPGGLALTGSVEIELDDTLATAALSEELQERLCVVTGCLSTAINRQFPSATKHPAAELAADDGDHDGYRTARPVHTDDEAPPFDEFRDQSPHSNGPPPARHVNRLPAPPPSRAQAPPPARKQASGATSSMAGKPPTTAGQLLAWLKQRSPEEDKYAKEVGKRCEYGSWIKEWTDEQAVYVYGQVVQRFASGFAQSNGSH